MSLTTFSDLLRDSQDRRYAVGSFNAWDMLTARSIVTTAERLRSPVIIALWQGELDFMGEKQLYAVCRSFAEDADVPAALFIDHAKEIEDIERAIALGATSVMIDGSRFPLDENIAFTRRAAEIAHAAGVSIEGEIGVLGEETGDDPTGSVMTDAAEARRFAAETGVDALAVAIGNAHGFYREKPELDFERLTRIREVVDTPLVLHGGTGIPDDDVRRAIGIGITKINVGAEGRKAYFDGIDEAMATGDRKDNFIHKMFPPVLKRHGAFLERAMRLFSSDGKA